MERVIGVAKVSSKGQITVPKEAREILGVKPGDKLLVIERDGEIILRKA